MNSMCILKKLERKVNMQLQIDLENMKERLYKRKEVLENQMEIERVKVLPAGTVSKERSDLAYDYEYRAHRVALLNRLEEQVGEVDQALQRIEDGTYGICVNCGKAIMPERLDALPYAMFCITCQRKE